MKDQNKLSRETWQYIIVDEAHRLFSLIILLSLGLSIPVYLKVALLDINS